MSLLAPYILFPAAGGGTAPSINAQHSDLSSTTPGTSFSGTSYTAAAGSNRLIVTFLVWRNTGTLPTSGGCSMDLGVTGMTEVFFEANATSQTASACYMLKEASIPSGSKTPAFTSDQTLNACEMYTYELVDVDQTTTIGAQDSSGVNSDATTFNTGSTTTANNSLVLACGGFKSSASGTQLPISVSAGPTDDAESETGSGGTQDVAIDVCHEEIASSSTAWSYTFTAQNAARRAGGSIEVLAA